MKTSGYLTPEVPKKEFGGDINNWLKKYKS
jgi:hypothetical protein